MVVVNLSLLAGLDFVCQAAQNFRGYRDNVFVLEAVTPEISENIFCDHFRHVEIFLVRIDLGKVRRILDHLHT